ncbi:MAG TPA: hypothetical protein VHZ95_05755, partial [Polyangiales bacterium]|nr:hypothetical protein [Polyangiales bacterium]
KAINAESARGLALGTGQRAASMSTSALAYNPAALVAGRVYHVEGLVDYMADLKTVALGGAVVDSSTSALGAGFALRGFLSGDSGLGGIDGRLALALPLSDAISIGLAGRYLNVTGEVDAPSGTSRERLVKGFTMDASLRVAPIPEVQLDIAAYNFINRDSSYAPIVIGGGAAFALADVAVIGADLLVDLTSFNKTDFMVGGGIEVFAGATVPLRVGYSYDTQRRQNTIGFGLGYTDASVGFDLSLRQDLGGLGDTRLMAAFRFYIH